MRKSLWYRVPLRRLIGVAALAAAVAVSGIGRHRCQECVEDAELVGRSDRRRLHRPGAGLRRFVVADRVRDVLEAARLLGRRGGSSELDARCRCRLPVVSNDGKTYTFTIKSGIKFNDGASVTRQQLRGGVQPGCQPLDELPGQRLHDRRRRLRQRRQQEGLEGVGRHCVRQQADDQADAGDGGLLDKLAMPFFCAIEPSKTPVNPQGVNTLPGSGPYYIADRTVGKQIVLKRTRTTRAPVCTVRTPSSSR